MKKNIFPKFVILKGSGGLTHMLSSIIYTMKLAKKYNYFLIIDVANHDAFHVPFSDFFYLEQVEYSEDYNIIPDNYKYYDMTISECQHNNQFKFDSKYNYVYNEKYIINKSNVKKEIENEKDIAIYVGAGDFDFYIMTKHIRINRNILNYVKSRQIYSKYLGIHYRNTDLKTNFDLIVQQAQQKLKENKDINIIYFATDHFDSIKKFKNYFSNYIFIYYTIPYKNITKNIHYSNPNKKELHTNLLIDMYMLSYSTVFIGNMQSAISCWIQYMRNNKNFRLFK